MKADVLNALIILVGGSILLAMFLVPAMLAEMSECNDLTALYPQYKWRYHPIGFSGGCQVYINDEWVTDQAFLEWLDRRRME